jgi:hypothetical protein
VKRSAPLFLFVVLLTLPAAAADLAVLPPLDAGGADALAAKVETELRAAFADEFGLDVLDAETTAAELELVVTMGMECTAGDTECIAKTGAVLNVSQVVVFELTSAEGGSELVVQLIGAQSAAIEGAGRALIDDNPVTRQEAVVALARHVVDGGALDETPADLLEEEPAEVAAPEATAVETIDASPAPEPSASSEISPMVWIGAGAAGLGALLVAVGAAGATFNVLLLETEMGNDSDKETRRGWQQAGLTMIAVGVGGGVLAAAGGGLAAFGIMGVE